MRYTSTDDYRPSSIRPRRHRLTATVLALHWLGLGITLAGNSTGASAQQLPEFPDALRRQTPVAAPDQAVVFMVNDPTHDAYAVDLVRRTGPDVVIRGFFKWNDALPFAKWSSIADQVRHLGARFGGGITCSALYDTENGITRAQLLDMATRGPDGDLVDAWGQKGIRHGSLSSPAYLDYLFGWCRQQIDAGADYLFMDEHTAVLQANEGYDDYSIADFRQYLLGECPQTRGWSAADARWTQSLRVALTDPQVCPGGDMQSFDYRAYLGQHGWTSNPGSADNPLAPLWWNFRAWRDDRAWHTLTDRIRAYAAEHNRTVWISANGLARYVDLQVIGVWNNWHVRNGQVDLTESQLPVWRNLVRRGRAIAGKPVPVVLFHDWGFGDTPFPFLAVSPAQRELWIRTRGAEIYAAGGFFAFPVIGPFGCDSARDGMLPTITRQTIFYQSHRDLYLRGRFLGTEGLASDQPLMSLAAWATDSPSAGGVAIHVINRDAGKEGLHPQSNVHITAQIRTPPRRASAISPDWEGEHAVACTTDGTTLSLTLDRLDAYAVILLDYPEGAGGADLSRIRETIRLSPQMFWWRGSRNEFVVDAEGAIGNGDELNGFLQGRLHTELRNPPTFLVNAAEPATLLVKVQAVASTGAQLNYLVDGKPMQTLDLPDLDQKNDANAAEYARVISLPIPAGPHRLTLDNQGPDWLAISSIEFQGSFRAAAAK